MNPTKIEWCDKTWNPVTGCLHGCEYCYARKIAHRFADRFQCEQCKGKGCFDCDGWGTIIDPDYFKPKFHEKRLIQPAKVKKPQKIFVCSMADLFGKWVPDEWIEKVFEACEDAPQHTYYFLTKAPARYYEWAIAEKKDNWWFGLSCTGEESAPMIEGDYLNYVNCKENFVSLEPLKSWGPWHRVTQGILWLIVGAQTNPTIMPKKEWIIDIRKQCLDFKIPLFEKNSLEPLDLPGGLIQEWPK